MIKKSIETLKALYLSFVGVDNKKICPTCNGIGGSISPGSFCDYDSCFTCKGKGQI
jgi:DnaJ-class molecular chaperone